MRRLGQTLFGASGDFHQKSAVTHRTLTPRFKSQPRRPGRPPSFSDGQPLRQAIRQAGGPDLSLCRRDVILQAAQLDGTLL